MLSGPFLAFYISLVADGIVTICLTQIYERFYTSVVYMTSNVILVFYVSYLEHQQQNVLKKMFHFLQNNCCQSKKDLLTLSIPERQTNSILIAIQELKLYFPYFQLRLFQMCVVDYSFVLNCFLFTFNIAILAIQTSKQT